MDKDMDSITQTFGIDASQALKALEALDVGFAKLESRLQGVATAMGRTNVAAKGVSNLGSAFRSNVPEATKHVERLTTSLGLLSRVVYTQFIVRAMSQIRDAIRSTAGEAAEFQKQIALTTTIADGAQFGQIADQVKRLSNEFNLPLLETAQGLYNTLSNQVGDFGESIRFAEEAARFAKATNSSLADSVDLLSAALASYGLKADDVDRVSKAFFVGIDKGRLTAAELSNSFGRIATVGADLGVSLEEMSAALAAISVRGTKSSEAITQLRAIMSALQKPSVAMRKTLEEMGFTSAETAIKVLTLPGVLDKLSKSTGGSVEQMAKLFPNIRGLSGASSLLSDDLVSLSANIREMEAAGRDFSREKFLLATATDAEKVTKEINILKNALTTELGQAALKTAKDLFELTGGAKNLIDTAKVAIPTLAGVAAALLAVRSSANLAAGGYGGLAKAMNALALVGVAGGVGASIGTFIENQRVETLLKSLNEFDAAQKDSMDKFLATQRQERDAFAETNSVKVQTILRTNASLLQAYQQDLNNLKATEKEKTDLLFSAEQARGGSLFSAKNARGGAGFDGNAIRAAKQQAVATASAQAAAFEKFKAGTSFDEGALEGILGRKFADPNDVIRGFSEIEAKAVDLQTRINTAVAAEKGIDDLRQGLFNTFKELSFEAGDRSGGSQALQDQYAAIETTLKGLSNQTQITEADLLKVTEARNKFGKEALAGAGNLLGAGNVLNRRAFDDSVNLLDGVLAKMKALKALQQEQSQAGNVTTLKNELSRVQTVIDDALPSFRSLTTSIGGSATIMQKQMAPSSESVKLAFQATDQATSNFNSGLTQAKSAAELIAGAAASTAAAYTTAAAAASQISANASSEAVNKAFGGSIYLAGGGTARGTDTVSAMLSPGEFVVNSKSAGKFYSQLQAINAGHAPAFRQDGGTVNNTSVGDIVVNGAGRPETTAREVMRHIRRETRRGSGSL